jgi:hypothetical protein
MRGFYRVQSQADNDAGFAEETALPAAPSAVDRARFASRAFCFDLQAKTCIGSLLAPSNRQ